MSQVIRQILPSVVACAESTTDLPQAPLFPEEEAVIAGCVPQRRAEFVTTRHCARGAMAALGVEPAGIPAGPRGEPRWPAGLTGSLTHCDGYRAAALSRAGECHVVAIDAEPHRPLPPRLTAFFTVDSERRHLAECRAAHPELAWETLMFSAKEAVYKAFNPLTGRELGYRDACVTFDPGGRTFRARLMVPGPVVEGVRLGWFTGHWAVRDGLVLTAITVRRGGPRVTPAP